MTHFYSCHNEIRRVKIGNTTVSVNVEVSYGYEADPVDIDFESEEEKEYLHKFETGEYSNLEIKVQVKALNETGHDFLGCVHVQSDKIEEQVMETVNEHGMIDNAISVWKNAVNQKYDELRKVFE